MDLHIQNVRCQCTRIALSCTRTPLPHSYRKSSSYHLCHHVPQTHDPFQLPPSFSIPIHHFTGSALSRAFFGIDIHPSATLKKQIQARTHTYTDEGIHAVPCYSTLSKTHQHSKYHRGKQGKTPQLYLRCTAERDQICVYTGLVCNLNFNSSTSGAAMHSGVVANDVGKLTNT